MDEFVVDLGQVVVTVDTTGKITFNCPNIYIGPNDTLGGGFDPNVTVATLKGIAGVQ